METTIDNNVEVTNGIYEEHNAHLDRVPYRVIKNLDREDPIFDKEKLMQAARLILEAVGRDPDNEPELQKTPERFFRAISESLIGEKYSNFDLISLFNATFEVDPDNDDLVTLCNIPAFLFCSHHLYIANLKISIGYIPNNGKVIGLSKLARIAKMCAARFQKQEEVGESIAEVLEGITGTKDCIITIKGSHSCQYSRGICTDAPMITATLKGRFRTNSDLRKEFYSILGNASKE